MMDFYCHLKQKSNCVIDGSTNTSYIFIVIKFLTILHEYEINLLISNQTSVA